MTEHPLNVDARKRWLDGRQAAFRAAIEGTHRFVWVDMNAPMHTNEPMTDGTHRIRVSPDVWRHFMPDEPPAFLLPYKPLTTEDDFRKPPRFVTPDFRAVWGTMVLLNIKPV